MDEDDDETLGLRWFVREMVFFIVGAALWTQFGWGALLVLAALAVPVNVVWALRQRSSKRARPDSDRPR